MMKILIIRMSAIGDIIHTLPVLTTLRENYPDAEIHWLVDKKMAKVLEFETRIDKLIQVELKGKLPVIQKIRNLHELINNLKSEKYDHVFDFQGLIKSAMISFFTSSVARTGFSDTKEYTTPFYTEKFPRQGKHVVEMNLSLIKQYFKDIIISRDSNLSVSENSLKKAEDFYSEDKNLKILINVGGGWETKKYPIEQLGKAIKIAEEKLENTSFYILHGPGEEKDAEYIENITGKIVPDKNLDEMFAFIKHSDLFISADTGPLHGAAAMKIPCIGLFGPTDFERNGPFNTVNSVIYAQTHCMNCFKRKCDDWHCMELIEPEKLADTIIKMVTRLKSEK